MSKSFIFKVGAISSLKVIAALLVFILNLLVVKVSSAYDAGVFFWNLTLLTLLSVVARLGYERVLIKYGSIYLSQGANDKLKSLCFMVFKKIFFVIGALLVLGLLFQMYFFEAVFPSSSSDVFGVMLLCLPFLTFVTLFSNVFQGLKRPSISVFLLNIAIPLFCVIPLGLYYLNKEVLNAQSISRLYLTASFATFCLGALAIMASDTFGKGYSTSNHTKERAASKKFYVAILMTQIIQWGTLIISGYYLEAPDLAYLNVAQRVAMLSNILLIGINTIISPYIAQHINDSNLEKLRGLVKKTSQILIIVSVSFLFLLFFYVEEILGFFGADFKTNSNIVLIIGVAQAFNVLTGSVGIMLMMGNKETFMRNNLMFCAGLSVFLAIALVSNWGIVGAAYAVAIPIVLQNVIAFLGVNKFFSINTLKFW
ncbi:MAG: hypothetical protein HWE16_19510 [Gammaproteobacteria bacterium]|nr:hypothetical protein [Gammaproteobacteria bacterium]